MTTLNLTMTATTNLSKNSPTTNLSTSTALPIGEEFVGTGLTRSLVQPDYSLIPINRSIISATLKMTPTNNNSNNARTMYAHRILKSVVFTETTWNVFSTGNSWDTIGCYDSASDYDGSIVLGSATQPANPTLNDPLSFTMDLNPDEITKFYNGTYSNYGIILFVDTEVSDQIYYASKNHGTAGYRPILTIEHIPTTKQFFMALKNRRN